MSDGVLLRSDKKGAFVCRAVLRVLAAMIVGLCSSESVWADGTQYPIDPRFGTIEFSVEHLGLFTYRGAFHQFLGHLAVDWQNPQSSQISVTIDTTSVSMSSPYALSLLRSPVFFNVDKFPHIRFVSTAISAIARNHYRIRGALKIRGIWQPEVLDAKTVNQNREDPTKTTEFVARGRLSRSVFGMTADERYISDGVDLLIRIRLAPTVDETKGRVKLN